MLMNRVILASIGLFFTCVAAVGQTFPYEDDFTAYPPGSRGAPAWSALRSLQWNPDTGLLKGPVFARFNLRPPTRFTAEIVLAPLAPTGITSWSGGYVFNGQDEKALRIGDGVTLLWNRGPNGATAQVSICRDGTEMLRTEAMDVADGPIHLRLTVDAETGRFAVYVGDKNAYTGSAEYAAGLLAVALDDEKVALNHFALRVPTEDEKRALMVTTLFNDPRDIADGGDGTVLVLHRGAPAVLAVTPDGEVTKSFGRRMPTGLTDPIAMVLNTTGAVLVLNRFPGEVVAYDHNGGIRTRFGKGKLNHPVDLVALPSGAVYVADAGGNKIMVFGSDGTNVGTYSCGDEQPDHLGSDSVGHLVVSYRSGKTVTLQTGAKPTDLSLVRESPASVSSAVGNQNSSWACVGDRVSAWPPPADGAGFTGKAVGGIGAGGRLATVGGTLYLLDRLHSRVVALPANVRDTAPEVTFQNIEGSSALLRWESSNPALDSRVHLLRGSTWDTVTQKNEKPATSHQVVLNKLKPGLKYRYTLSPTITTIPASDWSAEFTFETPGGEAKK